MEWSPRRVARIRILAIFAAAVALWLGLAALGAAFHHATWGVDPAGQRGVLTSGPLRPLANTMGAAAKPGWVIVVRVGPRHYDSMRSFGWAFVAHALSWGAYIGGAAVLWLLWRRWFCTHKKFPFVAERKADGAFDPSRRAALLHGVGGVIALGGGGAFAKATVLEPTDLRVRRFDVPIRGLPDEFDGLRLVLVSDTHLGPFVAPEFIETAVRTALGLRPDLVVLLGDYTHHDTREIDPGVELLSPLCAPGAARFGAVAVLGNHDWFSGASATREALRRIGAHLIENDRVYLDAMTMRLSAGEPAQGGLCVAGVGDLDHGDADVARALRGVSPDVPRVLVSHNPDVAEHPALRTHRVDLMLCGHTHGGQVRLPLIGAPVVPVRTGQRYADGLNEGPACPVVTSRGVGMSILPVRFNCPPEVVLVRLRVGTVST